MNFDQVDLLCDLRDAGGFRFSEKGVCCMGPGQSKDRRAGDGEGPMVRPETPINGIGFPQEHPHRP